MLRKTFTFLTLVATMSLSAQGNIKTLVTINDVQDVLKSGQLVIVKCFRFNCGPCTYMAPIFNNVATKFQEQVIFAEANVVQYRDLLRIFDIRSVPAFFFFNKQGQEVKRIMGSMSEQELSTTVENFIQANS